MAELQPQLMPKSELEKLWSDPAHWRGAFDRYHCPADPRLFVPMRKKWLGHTINHSHPSAPRAVLFVMAVSAVPMIAYVALGGKSILGVFACALGSSVAIELVGRCYAGKHQA